MLNIVNTVVATKRRILVFGAYCCLCVWLLHMESVSGCVRVAETCLHACEQRTGHPPP